MADTQRIAIVTGASRWIGRAIAMRLAESGLAVIVNYSGAAEDADEVVRAVQAKGGRARSGPTCRRPATWPGCSTKPSRPSVASTSS